MENLKLFPPTDATKQGPIVEANNAILFLRYDNESPSGNTRWGAIQFRDVLAYEVYQSVCSPVENIVPSNEVRINRDSKWLAEVVARWSEAVGWQEYQVRIGGPERSRHYQMYFDDVCCVQVIATTCDIQPDIKTTPV